MSCKYFMHCLKSHLIQLIISDQLHTKVWDKVWQQVSKHSKSTMLHCVQKQMSIQQAVQHQLYERMCKGLYIHCIFGFLSISNYFRFHRRTVRLCMSRSVRRFPSRTARHPTPRSASRHPRRPAKQFMRSNVRRCLKNSVKMNR